MFLQILLIIIHNIIQCLISCAQQEQRGTLEDVQMKKQVHLVQEKKGKISLLSKVRVGKDRAHGRPSFWASSQLYKVSSDA